MMNRTPIHSDELEALNVSAAELARRLQVPANRISQIITGKRSLSADTALRLGQYFGTSAEFWMNLQKLYELDLARQEAGNNITNITPRAATV